MSDTYKSNNDLWQTILKRYGDLLKCVSPGQEMVFAELLLAGQEDRFSFLDLVVRLIKQDMQYILESELGDTKRACKERIADYTGMEPEESSPWQFLSDDIDYF